MIDRQAELEEAIEKMRKGKPSRPDAIDLEMIKCIRGGKDTLLKLGKRAWLTSSVPSDWEKNCLLSVAFKISTR